MTMSLRCRNGHDFDVDGQRLEGNSTTCPECHAIVTLQERSPANPNVVRQTMPVGQRKSPILWIGLSVAVIIGMTGLLTAAFFYWNPTGMTLLPGKSDSDAVREIAERFVKQEHPDEMMEVLTEKARARFKRNELGPAAPQPSIGVTFAVGSPEINGDLAEVSVERRQAGEAAESTILKLRREPVGWRVYAFLTEFEPGNPDSQFEINLESDEEGFMGELKDSFESAAKQMQESMENSFNAAPDTTPTPIDESNATLEPMSQEQFDLTWKIRQSVNQEPAGSQIRRLAEELGLNFIPDEKYSALLERPITLPETECSRIEFLERVCAEAGLYTVIDLPAPMFGGSQGTQPELRLEPLPKASPIAFAGPFRLTFQIVPSPPFGIGKIRCRIWGPECPSIADGTLLTAEAEFTELRAAETDLKRDYGVFHYYPQDMAWPGFFMERNHGLKNLRKSTTSIEQGSGVIRLKLPRQIETVTFKPPFENAEQSVAGAQVTLRSRLSFDSEHGFEVSVNGLKVPLAIVARDEAGGLLRINPSSSSSSSGPPPSAQKEFSTFASPSEIQVRIVPEQVTVEYPFEVEGIPVPGAELMPDEVEPLRFEGTEPVTLQYVRRKQGDFGGNNETLEFRITNHCNKPIREAVFDGKFLDQAGQDIKSTTVMLTGRITTQVNKDQETEILTPVADSGAEASADFWSPFMPEQFSGMKLKPIRVEFCNGESWDSNSRANP